MCIMYDFSLYTVQNQASIIYGAKSQDSDDF